MTKKFKKKPDKIKLFTILDQNNKWEIILPLLQVSIDISQIFSHFKVRSSFFDQALLLF